MTGQGSIEHEYNRRAYHLRRLGFMGAGLSPEDAYDAYCGSRFWREAQAKYRDRGGTDMCFVCGARPVQLHHATYARLGFERPDDLVALCRIHHRSVSTLIDVHRYGFRYAHMIERQAWVRNRVKPETVAERITAARERLKLRGEVTSCDYFGVDMNFGAAAPIVVEVETSEAERLTVWMTIPHDGGPGDFKLWQREPRWRLSP